MKNTHWNHLLWLLVLCPTLALAQTRWTIDSSSRIQWLYDPHKPLNDHIEMSGEQVSTVLRYGVDSNGVWHVNRSIVWPMLRTVPNNTHASLTRPYDTDFLHGVTVDGYALQNEQVSRVSIRGDLRTTSRCESADTSRMTPLSLTRRYIPSPTLPMVCEAYTLRNEASRAIKLYIPHHRIVDHTDATQGVEGSYTLLASTLGDGTYTLQPQQSVTFYAYIEGLRPGQAEITPDVVQQFDARERFVDEMFHRLVFESPDSVLNTEFAFAKIRAAESIFLTRGGYMHCPGGEAYYAAIWANDQAEYANPLFPYLGYPIGNAAALNSFQLFARYMNDAYRALPSSIIAEGTNTWAGAGDRGDAAMIAYGASRYLLTRADRNEVEQLWPLVQWCLQYCHKQLTADGVVASDCDELEHRFPAGKANLCTSSLYYDALLSAAYLAREMGYPSHIARDYRMQAAQLHEAINRYFGATVEGYDTYRYYDGNDCLRSWICIPLVVGIFDRSAQTIEALLSPRLWTPNGLLSASGSTTFWDRSTLYALRGLYTAGAREKATQYLTFYSNRRLLGDHVPYPIEAWPEGEQRHLSAESALYCRIITEGLFGIRPTGFGSFDLTPQLPNTWERMALRRIGAFGNDPFDIIVTRHDKKLLITIERNGRSIKRSHCAAGETISCKL